MRRMTWLTMLAIGVALLFAAGAAQAGEALKVGFVYVSPIGDAGWTYQHDLGRKAVEQALGNKVTTKYVENVPEGADAERIIRELASSGHKLILTTSFGYMNPTIKVAPQFPNVAFMHATGYKSAKNVGIYNARFYEGRYLAGIVAGKMTKKNVAGYVAAFPIPEVLQGINAFMRGMKSVNPAAEMKVVWVNSWFDPPKETEAAQSLMNQGADVLLQNTDSTAVLQAAERNGKYAFGWDSDMSAFAPKAHLGSCVLNWGVYYDKAVGEWLARTWKVESTRWGVKEGMVDFVKMPDFAPEAARKKVLEAKEGLKAGTVHVFKGPVVDNTGKEVLARDVVADDAWKGAVNFYVKGVDGKVPAGK
jgi:basic membrane protein A